MRPGSLVGLILLASAAAFGAQQPLHELGGQVTVQWKNALRTSDTTPTTQYLANALTVPGNSLNRPLLDDLRALHTNDTRLQLWFSVPLQAVPELKEPSAIRTYWDFTHIDPVVKSFFANTEGKRHVNIGTIPRWMFRVPTVALPTDPAASFYGYTRGTNGDLLKDPTGQQFAEYQARIFRWYTQGGFTDELGKYHHSGYHFKIDYWGVMNESVFENHLTVEQYTRLYDAVVEAIRKIDPHVEFFGPEVVGAQNVIPWARYFLNHKNHSPGVPISWFSLHNYVVAKNDPNDWQSKYFTGSLFPKSFGATAAGFVDLLHQVIQLRHQLSPATRIAIDELGTFDIPQQASGGSPASANPAGTSDPYSAYNPLYWVASGANWAANFVTAERLGIPLISMTQMVGAPTQSESCSMINWDTAVPNAHYRVLQLINSNFGPGDTLVATRSTSSDLWAQASITAHGRRILLINTSNKAISLRLPAGLGTNALKLTTVDETSGEQSPRTTSVSGDQIALAPFAVAVVANQ